MKAKHLFLAIAALLAAAGFWGARSAWHTHAFHKSSRGVSVKTPHRPPKPGHMLNSPARLAPHDPSQQFTDFTPEQAPHGPPNPGQALNSPVRLAPPVPNRRFTDFTPEQRVQFARQGHGPGG